MLLKYHGPLGRLNRLTEETIQQTTETMSQAFKIIEVGETGSGMNEATGSEEVRGF